MADMGHDVLAIDSDVTKLERAAAGEAPFFEPGLEPLLRKNLDAGRLRFTQSQREIGEFGDVHFLCVGTPQSAGSDIADLSYLHAAADALAPHLHRPCLIVGKSTVPVGTARQLRARIQAVSGAGVELAWNPEFLREGYAVRDSLLPDRIVLGVTGGDAAGLLRQVYAGPLEAGVPALEMDLETAELVKVAANAFLATKISFINMMAQMCEAADGDVIKLAEALGHDERIGPRFLGPGLGFGGGCLPKDVRALRATAAEKGVGSLVSLLSAVDEINLGRRERVLDLATQMTGCLAGQRVAVLGIAFKPNSDDIRDSPSLAVCRALAARGALVSVHDPVAMPNAARACPGLRYADSVSEAAAGADLVMHLTEWADYRAIDPIVLGGVVGSRRLLDARCALDARAWRAAGWQVRSPGRPDVAAAALVIEVAGAGEVEGDAGDARCLDHFLVTDRPARLGYGADAAVDQDLQTVGEREERVGGRHGPGRAVTCPADRQPTRVHPVHLAHADPHRGTTGRQQDRV
jgi:UDPglucose 6-dehydrogenase